MVLNSIIGAFYKGCYYMTCVQFVQVLGKFYSGEWDIELQLDFLL